MFASCGSCRASRPMKLPGQFFRHAAHPVRLNTPKVAAASGEHVRAFTSTGVGHDEPRRDRSSGASLLTTFLSLMAYVAKRDASPQEEAVIRCVSSGFFVLLTFQLV